MTLLRGIFAPITTPFEATTGELDHAGMARNVSRLASTDLAGLVLFGTTGEGPLVDEEERKKVLERVRTAVPDMLILAAAWAESTRTATRLAGDAAAAGADAVLVAPPSYYRPQLTPEAVREYYVAVADASPLPVILYQIPPDYSGIELQTGLVAELALHPNIVGIKDSRGDLKALGELIETCPRDFAVMVGSGAVLYGALEAGSMGGILAVADLAPAWCCDLVAFRSRGDHVRAGELQERLAVISRRIVGPFGVPGVKAALDLLGQTGGPLRSPLRALGERDRSGIRETLDSVGLHR
jgi:4-hydroxy-2-oxoglutarate aldolase